MVEKNRLCDVVGFEGLAFGPVPSGDFPVLPTSWVFVSRHGLRSKAAHIVAERLAKSAGLSRSSVADLRNANAKLYSSLFAIPKSHKAQLVLNVAVAVWLNCKKHRSKALLRFIAVSALKALKKGALRLANSKGKGTSKLSDVMPIRFSLLDALNLTQIGSRLNPASSKAKRYALRGQRALSRVRGGFGPVESSKFVLSSEQSNLKAQILALWSEESNDALSPSPSDCEGLASNGSVLPTEGKKELLGH